MRPACVMLLMLLVVATMQDGLVTAQNISCNFPNRFVPAGQAPCDCEMDNELSARSNVPDGLTSSGSCQAHEYCFVQKDAPNICYQLPCDDISGSWVLYDTSQTNPVVVATVDISQSNCQATLQFGSDATMTELQDTTWYGTLRWAQHVWRLHVFAMSEYRNAYENNADIWQQAQAQELSDDMEVAVLLSNRKASASVCHYEGSTSDGVFQGGMVRNTGEYAVGDVMTGDPTCPEGYPTVIRKGSVGSGLQKESAAISISMEQLGYVLSAMAVGSLLLAWL